MKDNQQNPWIRDLRSFVCVAGHKPLCGFCSCQCIHAWYAETVNSRITPLNTSQESLVCTWNTTTEIKRWSCISINVSTKRFMPPVLNPRRNVGWTRKQQILQALCMAVRHRWSTMFSLKHKCCVHCELQERAEGREIHCWGQIVPGAERCTSDWIAVGDQRMQHQSTMKCT